LAVNDGLSNLTKIQRASQDEPTILMKEALSNGVLKTTYSGDVVMYLIPQSLMPNSSINSALNCGTPPSYARGCCCLTFDSYQTTNIPGFGRHSGFYFPYERFYDTGSGADQKFRLKVDEVSETVTGFSFQPIYDKFLPWDNIFSGSCTELYARFIEFTTNLTQCSGTVFVEAQKVYKPVNETNYLTCTSTQGYTYYSPLITPRFSCNF
jgi:hypothetical protein